MALSAEALASLVRLVASVDAAWMPIRREWRAAGHLVDARRELGVATRTGEGAADEAARKSAYRAVEELAAAGFVERVQRQNRVAVTPAGHREVRAKAWPVSPADFGEVVRRLIERTAAGDCFERLGKAGWVAETFLCGLRWGVDADWKFAEFDSYLLPALVAERVECNATTSGLAVYRQVAPLDCVALAELVDPDRGGEFCEELANQYVDQRTRARRRLISTRTRTTNVGQIPTVFSKTKSGRAFDDLRGIAPLPAFAEATSDA